jgi:hypothetical protein
MQQNYLSELQNFIFILFMTLMEKMGWEQKNVETYLYMTPVSEKVK